MTRNDVFKVCEGLPGWWEMEAPERSMWMWNALWHFGIEGFRQAWFTNERRAILIMAYYHPAIRGTK